MLYDIKTEYTGIVDVEKEQGKLKVLFPDGSYELIDEYDPAYDRFFDVIPNLIGYVSKHDNSCKLMVAPYAMLHNHGEYSLLDGMSTPKKIASKLLGGDSVYTPFFALTDHGLPSGLPSFDAVMSKANLCPISGVEVYTESMDGSAKNNHLILIAKNEVGFRNLSHLCTKAQNNFYYHPNVTLDMLREHHEGLICMSACLAGEINRYILAGDMDRAGEFIELYQDIFGDDFYLEVQNHSISDEDIVRNKVFELSNIYNIKVVATTDSHYVNKDDAYAHEVLLAIGTQKTITDPDRMTFDGAGYHILNAYEFYDLFEDHPEVIQNAFEIVKKCNFHFYKKDIEMPHFDIPDGYTEAEYFDHLTRIGYKKRFYGTPMYRSQEYIDRIKYELSIVHQMKFEGYFLIVQDFIEWAKNRGIAVGPGRGSAVGSLVSFCLGITDLDPIPYGLLFERFLNPERISMPDIDIDISDERRQEVIDYVDEKYGSDHVSRIITFGTLAPKMCVKDVGRVLEFPLTLTQQISDAIPEAPKMTLDKALKESPMLRELYDTNNDVQTIVGIAKKLEGIARNTSQHACGVVIAKNPIADNIPEALMKDANGNPAWTAVFNKDEIEENGCIKFDFLGLRNMSILKNASDMIGIDYQQIPLFDPEVYAYISTGDTEGIFQIESAGMKDLVRDMFADVRSRIKACKSDEDRENLGKECFERLVAAISLYRPGPLDYIPDYIAGMRDVHNIHYDTPELKDILSMTYGVICYQEQVQQICRKLAGYSYGRADLIRRGMAKKKPEIIEHEKNIFLYGNKKDYKAGKDNAYVPGCINNGISEDAAKIIWEKMEKFSLYAFNKSHSAGYAVISVRTAWLKNYHPGVFWTATLNSVVKKADKVRKYLYCAQKHGFTILPPSVNHSEAMFSCDNNCIRIGLFALRDLGKAAFPVIQEREKHGIFSSFEDLITRCYPGKKAITSLAYSGALDEFGLTRHEIVEGCDSISEYLDDIHKYDSWADFDDIDRAYKTFVNMNMIHLDEYPKQEKLNYEYKYAGMYVSEHPLDEYLEAITVLEPNCISDLVVDLNEDNDEEVNVKAWDKKVKVVGIIKEVETKITRKGEKMMVGTIEDKTGSIRFAVFAQTMNSRLFNKNLMVENSVVIMEGLRRVNDFGSQINVSIVNTVERYASKLSKIYCLTDREHCQKLIDAARECLPGNLTVILRFDNDRNGRDSMFIDAETGKACSGKYRRPEDARNLKVDLSGFFLLKEASRQIKVF